MKKITHEIRDPIHVFIKLDTAERKVLDSRPLQRLRYIHQLAMTYLIYPGATHKRFEHSLGVMELANRVFDIITDPHNVRSEVRDLLPVINDEKAKIYWKQVLRMAALCHDIGHLPFSHAAEKELLPGGKSHEHITRELIQSPEMEKLWGDMTIPLKTEDIVKIAVGPKIVRDMNFTDWETILSEIIIGDAFGVDRIDYLLRDSYHAGVAYGKFDHYRLIDTMRILPQPQAEEGKSSTEPILGIEEGGIHSAEALLLARYFMFTQVYLHPVRRIYDIHLKDFLLEWLRGRKYFSSLEKYLTLTDNQIISEIMKINSLSKSKQTPTFEYAERILKRKHFKLLYERNPKDLDINPEAGEKIREAAAKKFGEANVKRDCYIKEASKINDFPIQLKDDTIVSALTLSKTLSQLPPAAVDCVFLKSSLLEEAKVWLKKNKNDIIKLP
jgi:HD superfamily phosphohydrolase